MPLLATNTTVSLCRVATLAVKLRFHLAALEFQVCLFGSVGSTVPSRHRRAWMIASFEVEEEEQGPFPRLLGTVSR